MRSALRQWVVRHDGVPHVVRGSAPFRAAWLTGQSSWQHSTISPSQEAVLDDLEALGWSPLRLGYPWTTAADAPEYSRTPLVAASIRNTWQGVAARAGTPFGAAIAAHLQHLMDGCEHRLLLLCGSAGARMITAARPALVLPEHLRVDLIGVGPVGALPPDGDLGRVRVVRGAGDLLSRWSCPTPADVVVSGGHLDAARSARPAIVALAGRAALAAVEDSRADGAIERIVR